MIKSSSLDLGYNPHPEITHWKGTPIPPVHFPLELTPERHAIASRVWWNGPPWTVLRNSSHFLWHVMDYGSTEDVRFALRDTDEQLWVQALKDARPGLLSRGSYKFWSLAFDQMRPGEKCDWPDTAHRLDYRPLRHEAREQMRLRHSRSEAWQKLRRGS